jgi:hypothetical protein
MYLHPNEVPYQEVVDKFANTLDEGVKYILWLRKHNGSRVRHSGTPMLKSDVLLKVNIQLEFAHDIWVANTPYNELALGTYYIYLKNDGIHYGTDVGTHPGMAVIYVEEVAGV